MTHRITSVDGDLADTLNRTFTNSFRSGYLNVNGCILPQYYKEFVDTIENFEVRDDDVWLCGFPKTGTTWAQEMIWCIANGFNDDRNKLPLAQRFPLIESSPLIEKTEIMRLNPGIEISEHAMDSVNFAKNIPRPRFIKTHLPHDLLPKELRNGEKKPKFIYIVRNAKDTCISYYHYCKLVESFRGTFEECCELFLGDTTYYGPFWNNVLGYWEKRNDENFLFLKYEDMKKDLPSVIKRVAIFLDKNLTDEQVSLLTEHLSFPNMKMNPLVNYEKFIDWFHNVLHIERPEGSFIRSGQTEQWKTSMSPELIKRFDDWTREHLEGTGLTL